MELRSTQRRTPPEGWPPTKEEAVAMLRGFQAYAGRPSWDGENGRFTGESLITMSSDPRLEDGTCAYELEIKGDNCVCERSMPDEIQVKETWCSVLGIVGDVDEALPEPSQLFCCVPGRLEGRTARLPRQLRIS